MSSCSCGSSWVNLVALSVALPRSRAILLGSRGFDIPRLSQKLETLNAAKNLEAIEPVWETDIEVRERVTEE